MAAMLLTGCGQEADAPPQNLQATRPPAAQTQTVEHIVCARGNAPLTPDCTLDRERAPTGQIWTIRHPDGSFRRLVVKGDEIETADGAELLRGQGSDATVGDEHYRLPTR